MRRCKVCNIQILTAAKCETFISKKGFCGVDCATEWGKRAIITKREREHRQKQVEARDRLKTRSDWMKEAQRAFNGYIRARDFGLPCASCGAMPEQKFGGTMDCSHWRSVGSAPHLRFNVFNAAAACVKCNRHLSGNPVELEKGLIAKFGPEIVERIKYDQSEKRYDIDYLRRIKQIFSKRAKLRKKRYNID